MEFAVKEAYFDRNQSIDLNGKKIHFRTVLPRKAKTWMALDMAESG